MHESRESFWEYKQYEQQVVNAVNCLETLQAGRLLVLGVNHSSGHTKYQVDGLHVASMSANHRVTQKVLRDPIVPNGCLSSRGAKIYPSGGKRSTWFVEGVWSQVGKTEPDLGEAQQMPFAPGAPPPFHDWSAPPTDFVEERGTG